MEHEIVGWPPDGPTLQLDHERFSYAGKFVMSNTGKAVAREDGEVVAAVAFNEDRTDDRTLWLRYVTVRNDKRGEGTGPELLSRVREAARERGYDRLRIAVNNPYAFEALYRAGFAYTGETTGIAELVLEHPPDSVEGNTEKRYREGLAEFEDRDLTEEEERFLAEKREWGPPERID